METISGSARVGQGIAGMALAAIGCVVMLSASGTASADDGTAPAAGPGSVRTSAGQGEIRADGDQGTIRPSMKAVPGTKAHKFGDFGDNDYVCRSDWGDLCSGETP